MDKDELKRKVIDVLEKIKQDTSSDHISQNGFDDVIDDTIDYEKRNKYIACNYSLFKKDPYYYLNKLSQYEDKKNINAEIALLDDNNEIVNLSSYSNNLLYNLVQKITTKCPNVQIIKSLVDYVNFIGELSNNKSAFTSLFYRGHNDKQFDNPTPTIFRDKFIQYEDVIYREAIRRLPKEFPEDMTTFDKLVKMQHYETPTRLLDISSNPLVALYFACKDNGADGLVFVYTILNSKINYYDSNKTCIISNLAKLHVNYDYMTDPKYLIYKIQEDKPYYKEEHLIGHAVYDVICVLPKLNNDRIRNQSGAFLLYGMGENKSKPAEPLITPLKIIINSDAKKSILKDLDIMGINEAKLFPETDKVLQQIKLKYTK